MVRAREDRSRPFVPCQLEAEPGLPFCAGCHRSQRHTVALLLLLGPNWQERVNLVTGIVERAVARDGEPGGRCGIAPRIFEYLDPKDLPAVEHVQFTKQATQRVVLHRDRMDLVQLANAFGVRETDNRPTQEEIDAGMAQARPQQAVKRKARRRLQPFAEAAEVAVRYGAPDVTASPTDMLFRRLALEATEDEDADEGVRRKGK